MKKCFVLFILIIFPALTFASEKLIVLLDWFANPTHAPLFVSKKNSFF